jgi:hypothetical protein
VPEVGLKQGAARARAIVDGAELVRELYVRYFPSPVTRLPFASYVKRNSAAYVTGTLASSSAMKSAMTFRESTEHALQPRCP